MAQTSGESEMPGQAISTCRQATPGDKFPDSQNCRPGFQPSSPLRRVASLVCTVLPLLALAGCTGGLVRNASISSSGLTATPSSLVYGTLTVGQSAIQTASVTNSGQSPVVITSVNITNNSFGITDQLTLPLTLPAGNSLNLHIVFLPTAAGNVSAQVLISSGSSTQLSAQGQASSSSGAEVTSIGLTGSGQSSSAFPPVLTSLSCANTSFTGSGSDNCTVTLNGVAPSGGVSVSLSSNDATVTVPSSVQVANNSTSATFSATVAAVTTAQTVTLQASTGGVPQSVALQLNAAVPVLTVNATSINFGNVDLNTPSTQSVTLSSTGSLAVTVNGASVSGTGFTLTGATFPITLNPGQSTTLSVQFDPTTTGSATGQLTIASNSSTSGSVLIGLSGTGLSISHSVTLTWDAPANSPDPVASYNVYRANGGSTSYQLISPAGDTQTTYLDSTVQGGQTYDYVVRSVDSSGVESSPSNMTVATVP